MAELRSGFEAILERHWKNVVMVVGTIFSLGMAYQNLRYEIASKADKETVAELESTIRDIKGILCAATPDDYRCR